MTTYAAITALDRKRSLTAYIATAKPSVSSGSGTAFQTVLDSARGALATAAKRTYVVRPGDTLSSICETGLRLSGQDTSPEAVSAAVQRVARSNNLANANMLSSGQSLNLSATTEAGTGPRARLPEIGMRPRIVAGPQVTSTVKSAAASTATASTATASTDEAVAAGRQDGLAALREELRKRAVETQKGDALGRLAASLLDALGKTTAKQDAAAKLATQVLDKPAEVSSDFGMRSDPFTHKQEQHNGIDLAVESGTTVYAAQPGKVVFSGWQSGYGQTVIVQHADGVETLYAHNGSLLAKEGDVVGTRTAIARSGSTGRATGPHLHFEVRENGAAINPVKAAALSRSFEVAKAL